MTAPDARGALGRRISQDLATLTLSMVKDTCFANARANASAIAGGKSILDRKSTRLNSSHT